MATPPLQINRRRFLGCSAVAGLALSHGFNAEAALESVPIRIGMVGLGTRGTSLLRTLLELPNVTINAICDIEAKHRLRGQGIVEKAKGQRPESFDDVSKVLDRTDLDALVIAVPCDLHAELYSQSILAGKHLYAEKPLGITLAECNRVMAAAESHPDVVVHLGYQRRSNPRFRDGIEQIHRGDIGRLVEGKAEWMSSHGPMNGHENWLSQRSRSGDWMIEQAVHIWDVYRWIAGALPLKAYGAGRRDLFAGKQPLRDVTDHYSVQLEWPDGFHVSFLHSWVAPADDRFTGNSLQVLGDEGGFDFTTGALTFRDKLRGRQTVHPGTQVDTKLALISFLESVRSPEPISPPLSLLEARDATLTGLLVRLAVDERRVVTMDEVMGSVETPNEA